MRNILILVIAVVVAMLAWFLVGSRSKTDDGPRQKPIAVSKHSTAFNQSVGDALNSYYGLTEDFVNWDSTALPAKAAELMTRLDSLHLQELRKDSSGIAETAESFIANARQELEIIKSDSNIIAKRHSLNNLTQNLYDFMRTVKYDQSKLYLQECPMAFNDEEPGVWLSKESAIRNPYLGLHHPHYGKGMAECGSTKDTLNFMRTK